MRTVIDVESNTLELYLGYLADNGSVINIITEDDCIKAAKHFKCSKEMMLAWFDMLEGFKSALHSDLKDIWLRLDSVEARLG